MRKRTERTVLRRLQSPQLSSHPNPTVIVSFLGLKCGQGTGLCVFEARYDLLEEVKSLEELRGKKLSKGPAVSFPSALPSSAGPCLHSRASATQTLPGLQVCPSPEKRHPPLPLSGFQHAFLAS